MYVGSRPIGCPPYEGELSHSPSNRHKYANLGIHSRDANRIMDVQTFVDKTDKVGKVIRIYRNVEGTEKELCWVTMILLYVHRPPTSSCSPGGLDQPG